MVAKGYPGDEEDELMQRQTVLKAEPVGFDELLEFHQASREKEARELAAARAARAPRAPRAAEEAAAKEKKKKQMVMQKAIIELAQLAQQIKEANEKAAEKAVLAARQLDRLLRRKSATVARGCTLDF